MTDKKKTRPVKETERASEVIAATTTSVSDQDADRLEHTALVVGVETSNGHDRRNLYLSISAAERAVERAAQRGRAARVRLYWLVPVGGDE